MSPVELIGLLDYTSLSADDTPESIRAFCQNAQTDLDSVAAVCVYPQFIKTVKQTLPNTPVATVVNFPHGNATITEVLDAIKAALRLGADEIDVVIPYQAYLSDPNHHTIKFVRACKEACGNAPLKTILETGALEDPTLIQRASEDALKGGTDFLKTSTGKVPVGATLLAAEVMLSTLQHYYQQTGNLKGLKVSGGIRTVACAQAYCQLASQTFGEDYLCANTFRIGASSLLTQLQQR